MITTGVTGHPWRASISPWGGIEPWDHTAALNWFIAADDRWHVPSDEQSVRQARIEGTPVTETRVRVPGGDVVQRVFSVADGGGMTMIEVENESSMPVAVAFDRRDVLTERPIVDMPIEGIDVPDGSFVMPLGHQATLRVALAHGEQREGPIPAGAPTHLQVVRGWLSLTERASRLVVPDGELGASLAERVTAARCEISLGNIPHADDDAAGFAVALGEMVRMGEVADPWLPELVAAVESLGPDPSWSAAAGLAAAERVLATANERRAVRDINRVIAERRPADRPTAPPEDCPLLVAWAEQQLVDGAALLPHGFPATWLGQSLDVYGLPTAAASTVSFAIRWHGARPAVLWEQTGTPVPLAAPAVAPEWTTADARGEALWPEPPGAAVLTADQMPESFS